MGGKEKRTETKKGGKDREIWAICLALGYEKERKVVFVVREERVPRAFGFSLCIIFVLGDKVLVVSFPFYS